MSLFWLIPILLCLIAFTPCKAQSDSINVLQHKRDKLKDTLGRIIKEATNKFGLLKDTPRNNQIKRQFKSKTGAITNQIDDVKKKLVSSKPDSLKKSLNSIFTFKKIISPRPLLKFNRGIISYNTSYRSNIDTPFIEKNILQHNVYGNMGLSVAGIPLKINYLIRRSNSSFFRNINDVQAEFDVMQFSSGIRDRVKEQLLALVPVVNDSLLELEYKLNLQKFSGLKDLMNKPGLLHKLIESKEILNVPGITLDSKLSDSANKERTRVLKREAQLFIDTYEKNKMEFDRLKNRADSLERKYTELRNKLQQYRALVSGHVKGNITTAELLTQLKHYGIKNFSIPKKYQWLMNVRKLGLGKSQVNYSELTSKNMSLTGLNFEYNSWYYFAVAAGTVDYRFRDFAVNRNTRVPQYMYMMRLGIGKLEGTHFIVSVFKGQKQLFAVTNNSAAASSIKLSGIAAEGKFAINRNTYFMTEVAASLSPDFRTSPVTKTKLDFNDRSNKAIAAKFYSYLPKTASRFEAMYKYTGANFQSFSSFQTNSSLKSWYVKADQLFFKRKLKLAAAIRSNEFSNPYIIQQYKSNTVFKSIQATFRAKKLPVITAGFVPTSQVTSVDNFLVENQFYSFNAGVTHNYNIGERKANSVFIYNRFYNNENDTSYLYYNASNVFFTQTVQFSLYTMNVSVSHSKSTSFELNVLDGGLRFQLIKSINVGFGVKVNDFDRTISATGCYGSLQLNFKKFGVINMNYDNGFIPGNNHRFVRNEMMNFNFTRVF